MNPTDASKTDQLLELGRIGSALLDGDELGRIIADRSYYHIAHPTPGFRHMSGDYYDVDHVRFLHWKKMLMRLETLVDFPSNAAVWLRVKGLEDHLTVAVHNGSIHRYYRFGEEKRPPEPEMQQVLDRGEAVCAPADHPSGTVTVLAPIRNSLQDVVGVLELSALSASAELAPAYS